MKSIKNSYDVIVVGGGIVGAGVFRDLSLNNVSTLLIDKKDFSSQTSSKSSKMLHGGIRYLENMDFDLVFEALNEKNHWIKHSPELCYESSFLLPIYKDSLRPMWMVKAGLLLYDMLSLFQNSSHKMVNFKSTKEYLPSIRSKDLVGAGLYHDAIVDDARLTIEVIKDGVLSGGQAINHMGLKSFKRISQNCVEVIVEDQITSEQKTITCKELVLATGPFTDEILISNGIKWSPKLLASRGSHVWIDKGKLDINSPLVLTPKDGRVIFVIPQKGHILVGTTEVDHQGEMFDITPSPEEISYLIDNLNDFFPDSHIVEGDILASFAGIRPLVKEDTNHSKGKTARNHKYFQPLNNLHVIMGGKYTTFRVMAKEVCQVVCNKLAMNYSAHKSLAPFKQEVIVRPFENKEYSQQEIEEVKKSEFVRTEEDLQRRLSPYFT